MSDNKHLTLDERRIIEKGINSGATKTSIADTIGKDNSTIGKEIKQHRKITYKCHFLLNASITNIARTGEHVPPSAKDMNHLNVPDGIAVPAHATDVLAIIPAASRNTAMMPWLRIMTIVPN